MTLIKELQINITMSNYNERSGSYSTGVWYHAVLTITPATTTSAVTRGGNAFVLLSAATPAGLDTNYDDNQLCLSKCRIPKQILK